MNKIYTDDQIRIKLNKVSEKNADVPPEFHASINEVLNSLPDKRKTSNIKRTVIAASILLACLVSAVFINPALAENIPLVGTVFKQISKNRGENENNAKYSVGIGKTQTSKGLSYTVTEAAFDGSRLVIGFTIKSDKSFTAIDNHYIYAIHEIEVDFNGQKMKRVGAEPYGEFTGPNTFVGVLKCDFGLEASTLADKAGVTLDINRIVLNKDTFLGEWNFKFTVDTSKTAPGTRTVKSDFVYKTKFGDIKIFKVTTTPLATTIFLEVPQGRQEMGDYSTAFPYTWIITDDKGNKLEQEMQMTLNGEDMAKAFRKTGKYIPEMVILRLSKVSPETEYIIINGHEFEVKIPLK